MDKDLKVFIAKLVDEMFEKFERETLDQEIPVEAMPALSASLYVAFKKEFGARLDGYVECA